jgi:enolase
MEKDMTVFDISELSALEILDSRGRPTLATTLRLGDGTQARAGVPSGVRARSGRLRGAASSGPVG